MHIRGTGGGDMEDGNPASVLQPPFLLDLMTIHNSVNCDRPGECSPEDCLR